MTDGVSSLCRRTPASPPLLTPNWRVSQIVIRSQDHRTVMLLVY